MKLRTTLLSIPADKIWLDAQLSHAPGVRGLALLVHPHAVPPDASRDAHVATVLHEAGFATLVAGLVTRHEEARDADIAFNVPLLANRMLGVTEWIGHQPPLAGLRLGVVASGTASGAAVRAGWKAPERFSALVCRAGRPDLAGAMPLRALRLPACFVVGSLDPDAGIVEKAYAQLQGAREWQVIEGAGPLLQEPGTLTRFAELAGDWLLHALAPSAENAAQTAAPGVVPAA